MGTLNFGKTETRTISCCSCSSVVFGSNSFLSNPNSLLDFISSTVTNSVASGDWTTTSSLLSPDAPSGFKRRGRFLKRLPANPEFRSSIKGGVVTFEKY